MFNASEFVGRVFAAVRGKRGNREEEAETFYIKSALVRHNFASVMSAILTLRRRSSVGCRTLSVFKRMRF